MSNIGLFRGPLLQPPSPTTNSFLHLSHKRTYRTNENLNDLERNSFPALQIASTVNERHGLGTTVVWPPSHKTHNAGHARLTMNHCVQNLNLNQTSVMRPTSCTSGVSSRLPTSCRRATKRRQNSSYIRGHDGSNKKQRIDEEITNQLIDFHISPQNSRSHDDMVNDLDICAMSSAMDDGGEDEEDDSGMTGLRLHIHRDVSPGVLQSESVLPLSIIEQIRKPCMELVLWQPIPTYIPTPEPPPGPPPQPVLNHDQLIPVEPVLTRSLEDISNDDIQLEDSAMML